MSEKSIKKVGTIILCVGIVCGLALMVTPVETVGYFGTDEEFSVLNFAYGIVTILFSVLIYTACDWMGEMLGNSRLQTLLLKKMIIGEKVDEKVEINN